MMPTSLTDLAICLYLIGLLDRLGTVFSGSSADMGKTAMERSKPIFTWLRHVNLSTTPSRSASGRGSVNSALSAQERDEVFVGEQPAQRVDDEQQAALAHRSPS